MTTTELSTDVPAAPAASSTTSARRAGTVTQLWRMFRTELVLFARETQALVFVFAFPVITVLVLSGVFGTDTDDSGFEFVNPSHFYVAAYFGVVLAAISFIMLPVHVASYREQGILRRFDTSGFPKWAFPAALFGCGIVFALLGFAALLTTGLLSNGIPEVDSPGRTIAGVAIGTLAFISLGVAIGTLMPNARAAQGTGLMLFFPMFLLAGAGPPPEALSSSMRSISDWLPLTHVIRAIQEPWLSLGDGSPHLAIVFGIFVVSTSVWMVRSTMISQAS